MSLRNARVSAGLWQRLSMVFAALLITCSAVAAWLQLRASDLHEEEVTQRLSHGLASHIAGHTALLGSQGLDAAAVKELFGMLMVVNPSVEVYLLGLDGKILAHVAPDGHLKRDSVDLRPVRRFIDGGALPISGDDPRSTRRQKVFSAAPLVNDGRAAGYVYVVLLGEDHDALATHVGADGQARPLLWITVIVGVVALGMGLLAFAWITRPLRALTTDVQRFEREGFDAATMSTEAGNDEIGRLRRAFVQMARRIGEQWRALTEQDQQRRELVANISHDLRTPLTSLHGYLETLSVKSAELSEADRRRYLDTALAHSRKVGRLAQELFELARLEYGGVKPDRERFSLAELTQDVFQKFELGAQARRLSLRADFAPGLPAVSADVGLIERVLTNLVDNAVRATPEGGEIRVRLRPLEGGRVDVRVSDTGPGVPGSLRAGLFKRPSPFLAHRTDGESSGGLGLLIVQRILALHGSDIELIEAPGDAGTTFRFALSAA